MRGPHPGRLAAVNLLALVAALLVTAVEVGVRVPSARILPTFPSVRAVDFPDVHGRIPQLRSEFVRGLLGDQLYQDIFGTPSFAPDGTGDDGRDPRRDTRGDAPSGPPPATLEPGRLSPVVAPGSWVLVVTAEADRQTVARGEVFTYVFTIENVGRDPFVGDLSLEWHVPFGTTGADGAECFVAGEDVEACRELPVVPVPGAPSEDVHQGQFQTSETIDVGEVVVVQGRVRVNETTEPGTTLRNHGHMDVVGDADPAVTTNTVEVTVT